MQADQRTRHLFRQEDLLGNIENHIFNFRTLINRITKDRDALRYFRLPESAIEPVNVEIERMERAHDMVVHTHAILAAKTAKIRIELNGGLLRV